MGLLTAERIKLTSTRSPLWCTGLFVLIAVGLPALRAWVARYTFTHPSEAPGPPVRLHNEVLTAGSGGFGYILVSIVATLAVTSEYRFGTIKTTFLATPNRALVLGAKAGLIAVAAAVLSALTTLVSIPICRLIAGKQAAGDVGLRHDVRVIYGIPIFMMLVVVLSVGVGALLRQTAGALSLLIIWPLLLEPLVLVFGSVGGKIEVWLPFQNALRFVGMNSGAGDLHWHWGPWGGLVYFAGLVMAVFVAAVLVTMRRDA